MSSIEDEAFLSHYQSNKFNEGNDPYLNARAKRNCLTLNYYSSITLTRNDSTCHLLETDLKSYSEHVDRRKTSDINNYAKIISMISPQSMNLNASKWKSGLHSAHVDPKTLLKPFPHENNQNCYLDVKPIHLQQLLEYKPNICIVNGSENISQNNLRTIPVAVENKPVPKSILNRPVSQASKVPFPKNSHADGRTFAKTSNPVNRFPKKSSDPPIQPASESNADRFFRTARAELNIQNATKQNKNTNNSTHSRGNSQPMFAYGSQKKSLGSRRNVQSKFIPPDRDESTLQNNPETDEVPDERLRNIDPKMVELIRSEIMDCGSPITWDDIAGLEFAKNTIQEIVVWPLLRPDIFTGLRRPPKGILLFGPPGTGKTLIGKCIASQSQSTFFSISASSLTSKWIGDGEKMVRALFAVARCHQPAVIFIDEIDSLLTQRSETEHESSRRMKTEFLVQLDGAATGDEDRILIIGATNRPQELDEAARRRLVKRLYIPLPEHLARKTIVERLMSSERNSLRPEDIEEVANLSAGYSGADMKNLCAEASLGPIRSIHLSMIQNIQPDQVRPINFDDFRSALNRVRASVSASDLEQYITWDNTYGSGKY